MIRTNEDPYDQLANLIATCTIPITDPDDTEPLLPLGPGMAIPCLDDPFVTPTTQADLEELRGIERPRGWFGYEEEQP